MIVINLISFEKKLVIAFKCFQREVGNDILKILMPHIF